MEKVPTKLTMDQSLQVDLYGREYEYADTD
jgi:hypothetical protein